MAFSFPCFAVASYDVASLFTSASHTQTGVGEVVSCAGKVMDHKKNFELSYASLNHTDGELMVLLAGGLSMLSIITSI